MQAHAQVALISVALIALSGCAEQELADTGHKPAPRASGSGEDPYDYSSSYGGAAQSNQGGGASAQGGSAGRGSGASGSVAASGTGGRNPGSAGTGLGSGGSGATSGAAGAQAIADCPSLTLARMPSGACVPRVTEYDVAEKPTSIVLGSDGRIWVDDEGRDELLQLDDQGGVIGRVSCEAGSAPRALAGGKDDALFWYTDSRAKTLVEVTSDQKRAVIPLGFAASALALGAGGDVFLTEFGKAVYCLSPSQSTLTRWESSPTDVLVISPENKAWFSQGSALGQLSVATGVTDFFLSETAYASGLCLGPDAGLWFSDGFADQLVRVQGDGTLSRTINLPTGTAPGRIITGPDGAFWFAETGTNRIGRVTLEGQITHYPLPTPGGLPHALTVGSDHHIWFTTLLSHKVGRLIPDPSP